MASRVAVYTLRIMGPDLQEGETTRDLDARNQAVAGQVNQVIGEAEELLNMTLPEGYYAKIEDA